MATPILAPSVAHNEQFTRATGIHAVPGGMVQLPGHITPDDLAIIDFDVHGVEGAGLYALELLDAGRVVWSGCRAFDCDTSGAVFPQEDGARRPVEAIQGLADWRVAGKVVEIVPNTAATGWTPIITIPAGVIGGIETGRMMRLPALATQAQAAAAALDAMVAWPAAVSSTAERATLRTLPGRWREVGGLDHLVRLDTRAVTLGMVVVARAGEDWRRRPELRFQVWPEDLELVDA